MDQELIDHINKLIGFSFLTVTDIVDEIRNNPSAHQYIREKSGEKKIHHGIRKLKTIARGEENESPYSGGSSNHEMAAN